MSKKYKVDRQLLINSLDRFDLSKLTQDMRNSLVLGGEFIVTAEDVLDSLAMVPAKLLTNHDPTSDPSFVKPVDCEVVYVDPKMKLEAKRRAQS